jgi:NitT/TauT family transport system ATP-binding protein
MESIRIQHVSVEYPVEGRGMRRILNDIDLEIESGAFVSIVGQTGCGKSTLLRLILGEESPSVGQVLVDGEVRQQPGPYCGYVPQRYSLFPDKTVLDNIIFGLDVSSGGSWLARRTRMRAFREEGLRYLHHVGLHEADARKYPHQLSGGMQQRVAIAQALILTPRVLLMDEAFSALDPGTRSGMQRLIKKLWRESGTTIVFVTHNTREAVCLGTRVIALAKDISSERGSSVALDLSVPHLNFDSEEEDLRGLIQEVESASFPVPQNPLPAKDPNQLLFTIDK